MVHWQTALTFNHKVISQAVLIFLIYLTMKYLQQHFSILMPHRIMCVVKLLSMLWLIII